MSKQTQMAGARNEALVAALRKIAFLRPLGPCRSKLVEQMERIAIDALDADAIAALATGEASR